MFACHLFWLHTCSQGSPGCVIYIFVQSQSSWLTLLTYRIQNTRYIIDKQLMKTDPRDQKSLLGCGTCWMLASFGFRQGRGHFQICLQWDFCTWCQTNGPISPESTPSLSLAVGLKAKVFVIGLDILLAPRKEKHFLKVMFSWVKGSLSIEELENVQSLEKYYSVPWNHTTDKRYALNFCHMPLYQTHYLI